MEAFCGKPGHVWGPVSHGHLTQCFEDIVLYGTTYAFIFLAGSIHLHSIIKRPRLVELPPSKLHFFKVALTSLLAVYPLFLFSVRFATQISDEFEWISKPLASMAWFYSLMILNIEYSRGIPNSWVLKAYWAMSVIVCTACFPTTIIEARTHGFKFSFFSFIPHYLLYVAIAVAGIVFKSATPDLAVGEPKYEPSSNKPMKEPPLAFLWIMFREDTWRVFSLFSGEKYLFLLGTLALCLSTPLSALPLVIMGRLLNNFYFPYSAQTGLGYLKDYCLSLGLVWTITSFLDFFYYVLLNVAGARMAMRTRRKIFHSILRQDMSFFDSVNLERSVLSVLTHDVMIVSKAISELFGHGVECTITALVAVGIQLAISWKLTLVTLAFAPLCYLVMWLQTHFSTQLRKEKHVWLDKVDNVAKETLTQSKVVRAFAAQEHEVERFNESLQFAYERAIKAGILDGSSKSAVNLVVQFSITLALYVGGLLVLGKELEVGYLATFVFLSFLAVSSSGQMRTLVNNFSEVLESSDRIYALLQRQPQGVVPKEGLDPKSYSTFEGRIEFVDVTFAYPPPDAARNPILMGCSFTIQPSQTTGLVGAASAGKSTIVALMQRMYDPQEGRITLDGVDIKELQPNWLREQICVAQQDPVLFSATIGANITYGRGTTGHVPSMAQIEKAARRANAHTFIKDLPDGFQQMLGDKSGFKLTPAQRRQIGLARVILMDPQLLVVDQTIDGMDAETQHLVLEGLQHMRKRTTVLISRHQMVLQQCQHVLVLDHGQIVEEGTAQELMHSGTAFKSMVRDAIEPIGQEWQEQTETDNSSRQAKLLSNIEQELTKQNLDPANTLHLLEIVNEIKEAMILENQREF